MSEVEKSRGRGKVGKKRPMESSLFTTERSLALSLSLHGFPCHQAREHGQETRTWVRGEANEGVRTNGVAGKRERKERAL